MFSRRINNVAESKSIKLSATLAEMKAKGIDVIGLNVGEPDFPTPESIKKATKNALDQNHTRYSLVHGLVELRQLIASWLNIDVSYENIFLGNGSKHILYNIFQTLIDEGDEVIVPIPYWVTFPESIKLAGGIPVEVNSLPNHQLHIDAIKSAITEKTKAIIINSPNNPSGAVYPEEDLRELCALAEEKDLFIISDEAYDRLLFDGKKKVEMSKIHPRGLERVILVQSFSKSFCMTGFRIGYMVASKEFISGVNKLQSHLSGNNCTFAQFGAIEAITNAKSHIDNMVSTFEKRRNLAYQTASKYFDMERPGGAFYLFPNIKNILDKRGISDSELATGILNECRVAILPGSAFGHPECIRICYSNSEELIVEGISRIGEFLCK